MSQWDDYRQELVVVRKALEATIRDLEADLVTNGLHLEAVRVDEAAAFVKASFRSLDVTLAKARKAGR